MKNKIYCCIDLKSFYASVECVERNLDPFQINLVVADPTRGNGAITLAATPAIKKLGVKSRGRIFEIPKNIEYMIATPRMKLYMEYSAKVYSIFLRYVAKEDIHVYSIDEAFLDVTPYLELYQCSAKQLAKRILNTIFNEMGLTATVGIGTNLFLAKVALDICAKHTSDNMGFLNQKLFCQTLWTHTPLTDFWMIGKGTEKHLQRLGLYTLKDVTQFPEDILYREFGINAEILIDHAYGKEPVEMKHIKAYQPKVNSISNSQILFEDYTYEDAKIILREMVDINILELVEKRLVSNYIALFISYSKDCHAPSRGSTKISCCTNSFHILMEEFELLYNRVVDKRYPIRQISISFGNVKNEMYEQYDLFTDYDALEKEKKLQQTMLKIREIYGKNACLKGTSYQSKATARYRNTTIGGHKA